MKKRMPALLGLIAVICTASFGQDLVEAAKKEKERRDAQKGGNVVAITNQTLSDLKKKPSVPSIKPEGGPDLNAAGNTGTAKRDAGRPATALAPLSGPEPESPGPATREQQKTEYRDRYERAKERLDLLGLKMLSLRQQLTTFDSMQSKEKVQKDFAETYQKFLQAQADAAKAKEDLDRLGEGGAIAPSSAIK